MKKKKPFVFINCAMSADGKLSTYERKQVKISNAEDLLRVDLLRASADAVLVGMKTVVSDDPKLDVKSPRLRAEREAGGMPSNPLKAAVGCVNQMSLDSDFLDCGGRKIIFTTERSDPAKIKQLEKKAKVHVLGKEEVDLPLALRLLADSGVERLMVEGGGTMNYGLLKQGLVDEIYVAVGPRIFGGSSSPTMVDGQGFSADEALELRLLGSEKLGEVVVLRYGVARAREYI